MTCEFLSSAGCEIANRLAGANCRVPSERACQACADCDPPREANWITVSLALGAVRSDPSRFAQLWAEHGHHIPERESADVADAYAKARQRQLQEILASHGVGSQLWRMLESIGVKHDEDCGCLGWAERLNAWGPAGCRLQRDEIAVQLRRQSKRLGWRRSILAAARSVATGLAFRLRPAEPFGSLVDEAIRRAEAAEEAADDELQEMPTTEES